MQEKLLKKPPFRYLHDIFTATMASTGYANGLYDEAEMDAKSITDKDAKINVLAKMIALTELMLDEKIVAIRCRSNCSVHVLFTLCVTYCSNCRNA